MAKYNAEIVKAICDELRNGEHIERVCVKVGINKTTFFDWVKKKPNFSDAIEKAKAEFNKTIVSKLEKSLWEVAMGYSYEETKTEYTSDKDGNPIISKQTTTTKKVAPNVAALIFALTNRAPEEWKNRQTTEVNANVKAENVNKPDLSAIPDELLEQVLNKINGGE